MRARLHPLRWLLAALLAGCGGSGSSGFDPSILEGMLIDEAITDQRCVDDVPAGYDLPLCPSGVPVDDPVHGLPSPGELLVTVTLTGGSFVDCGIREGEEVCRMSLDIETEGLPAGSELRVAARITPDGAWSVGPAIPVEPVNGNDDLMRPVTFDFAPPGGAEQSLRVAVLVFLTSRPSVPSTVKVLTETGADYAFVAPPLPVTTLPASASLEP